LKFGEFAGKKYHFQHRKVSDNGDCAFLSLCITRKDAYTRILTAIQTHEAARANFAEELTGVFQEAVGLYEVGPNLIHRVETQFIPVLNKWTELSKTMKTHSSVIKKTRLENRFAVFENRKASIVDQLVQLPLIKAYIDVVVPQTGWLGSGGLYALSFQNNNFRIVIWNAVRNADSHEVEPSVSHNTINNLAREWHGEIKHLIFNGDHVDELVVTRTGTVQLPRST
jgi:hypothetical protein